LVLVPPSTVSGNVDAEEREGAVGFEERETRWRREREREMSVSDWPTWLYQIFPKI